MDISKITEKYKRLFKSESTVFKSPGRINLIGEHTDYNDGFVLPAAIDKYVWFALGTNNEKLFKVYAVDFDAYFEISMDEIKITETSWANYLIGVIAQLKKQGRLISGVNCVFGGDIPIGAGLSSSAAIESGFIFGLNVLFNFGFTKLELTKLAQKAEHEYAGVMCGIMDQFGCLHGKKEHVIQLDCRTLKYKFYSIDLKDYSIVLCDTKVKHSLASSAYNQRRKECEAGVTILNKYDPSIVALRDVSLSFLMNYKDEFDPVIFKRCKFVLNENQRVINACNFLNNGNIIEFGNLMFASHSGLKEEYEVSCKELDLLVDLAMESEYVIGARMMGGGFGGCTINLVKKEKMNQFVQGIELDYEKEMHQKPAFYFINIADGTSAEN